VTKFRLFLKQVAPISDKELEETLPYFKETKLKKGDIFVSQGKVCKKIGFINSGMIRIFYLNHKAEETTYGFCNENCITTSFKSFITQTPSDLILQAVEDTVLLTIDYQNLQKLYEKYPIWQNIGRIITQSEFLNMEQYASILNNEGAKEKYLRLLREQPSIIQKAKIEDIASYLGITRRTLSRIRKEINSN
jgi:CRP-like cAMP-binding protein